MELKTYIRDFNQNIVCCINLLSSWNKTEIVFAYRYKAVITIVLRPNNIMKQDMFLSITYSILRQLLLDKQYYETEHVFIHQL